MTSWASITGSDLFSTTMRGLLLSGIMLGAIPTQAQKSILFTWIPGVNQGWTPCSSGHYCLTGFTLYEISTGTPVAVAQIPQTATTYTMSPLPSKGSHSYELVQTGTNGTGAAVQSLKNPGLVVNCRKAGLWRTCSIGKSW